MLETIIAWVDAIFNPVHSFLDLGIEQLRTAQQVTAQGIDFSQYTRVFGDMPPAWQMVLTSLFISTALIGGLFIFRSIMRVYYAKKDAVKWW